MFYNYITLQIFPKKLISKFLVHQTQLVQNY